MRRVPLRLILTALVVVTSAPLAGFAAWLTWTSGRQQQALVEAQNIERVRATSAAIDLEVERTMGALGVLARLDPIDLADHAHFTQISARMVPLNPSWRAIRLIDPSLRIVANTDPSAPVLVKPEWARQIFETGRGGVSTVRQDPSTGEWVVNVGIPVVRGGKVRYVLGARLRAAALGEMLLRQEPPEGGVLTLLDSEQTIIARTRNADRYVGGLPAPDFLERSRAGGASGTWRGTLLEGTPAYSAWCRSELTGWTLGLGMPSASIDGPVRRRTAAMVGAGLATLGTGLLIAILLGRSIVRAQVAAAASARALARGEPVPIVHSYIKDADELGVALQDAAKILEQRIQERDAAAAALNRAKDDLVATVSHELRTPLNAIYGWVAMLRTGTLDAARQAHALDVIERNARAQSQVVEDLLDMSSIVHGRMRLSRQPVDVTTVVRAAVDLVAPAGGSRRTRLVVRTGDESVVVTGDPARLQQIVWNLVANAMKFTPADGRIEVSVGKDGGDAVVTVSDTGEGIAPEFLPHVFDRFRQETEQVTRQHSGLGIGLSLAKTLAEMHGGSIKAESAGKGLGATFTVRLPLHPAVHGIAAPSAQGHHAAGQI